MAYNAKSLSRENIGAASGAGVDGISTSYFYRTADTKAQIEAAGYFNSARDRLKKGDVIRAVTDVGNTPVLSHHVVTAVPAAPGNITIAGESQSNDIAGVAAGYKVARGQHTSVAASDTIETGLATVVAAVANLDDDPVDGVMEVTCSIGNQAGAPAAGSILIKGWKRTDADETPIAATTFGKKINWIAFGV